MFSFDDTIIALATPPGTGALAIIRISGKDAVQVADALFRGRKKLAECSSHTIHYGKIISADNDSIDDVLVSLFIAPHSYTGEDVVEISTHGNPIIAEKIISLFVQSGVRPAEPGEFTRRAFMNSRLDLAQAEAVAEVISARTAASLKGARNQLDGLLSQRVNFLRSRLVNTSSLLELELDFSEEDLELIDRTILTDKIKEIISEINELLGTYSFGRVIRDGVNVAIAGKPNVGKSSLLNYLLKESRAIVSEIPGTTRDIIREEISVNGILFRLFDTAGIRLTEDEIEKEGVLRSREAVKNSDFVLLLTDTESDFPQDLLGELQEIVPAEKIITVINKCDLKKNTEGDGLKISAKTGEGIKELLSALENKARGSGVYTEKTAIVSNVRHFNSLKNAVQNLESALSAAAQKLSPEFISIDLRNAEYSLREIIGEVSSDDILNNIFASFCIGK